MLPCSSTLVNFFICLNKRTHFRVIRSIAWVVGSYYIFLVSIARLISSTLELWEGWWVCWVSILATRYLRVTVAKSLGLMNDLENWTTNLLGHRKHLILRHQIRKYLCSAVPNTAPHTHTQQGVYQGQSWNKSSSASGVVCAWHSRKLVRVYTCRSWLSVVCGLLVLYSVWH